MSQTNDLIINGERRAQQIRPATITYPLPGGDTIPCSLGNWSSFQRLKLDGGGFQWVQALHVKVLRSDITAKMLATTANFFRGQFVTVTNLDPQSPGFNETLLLVIGDNNVWQPMVLQINLEKQLA